MLLDCTLCVGFDDATGADALVLGAMPADEIAIREMEGQGAFAAEMRINVWQKRMRVSGRVNVEFIARGTYALFVVLCARTSFVLS